MKRVPSSELSAYLNRGFSSGAPAQFLGSRIHYLLLVAGPGKKVYKLLTQGTSSGA